MHLNYRHEYQKKVWGLTVVSLFIFLIFIMIGWQTKIESTTSLYYYNNSVIEFQGAYPKDYLNTNVLQEIEVSAQLVALVATEVLFYPLETILHR